MFDLYGDRPKPAQGIAQEQRSQPGGLRDLRTVDGRLDVDALLAAMSPTGAGVNDVQPRALLALLQQGIHPGDIVGKVVNATMAMAESHETGWDRKKKFAVSTHASTAAFAACTTSTIPRPARSLLGWPANPPKHGSQPWPTRKRRGSPATTRAGTCAHGLSVERKNTPQPATQPRRSPRPQTRASGEQRQSRQWAAGPAENPGDAVQQGFRRNQAKSARASVRQALSARPGHGDDRLRRRREIYRWNRRGYCPRQRRATCSASSRQSAAASRCTTPTTTARTYRRVAAFCRHHGVPIAELAGWLFIDGKDSFTVRVAGGNGNLTIDNASIAQITETIVENQIDVVIFDPLRRHARRRRKRQRQDERGHSHLRRYRRQVRLRHRPMPPHPKASAGIEEKEFNSDDSRGSVCRARRGAGVACIQPNVESRSREGRTKRGGPGSLHPH